MKKLNLPVIRENLPPSKSLSMDDYVEFIKLHRKYTFDRKAHEDWGKRSVVIVPFVLK